MNSYFTNTHPFKSILEVICWNCLSFTAFKIWLNKYLPTGAVTWGLYVSATVTTAISDTSDFKKTDIFLQVILFMLVSLCHYKGNLVEQGRQNFTSQCSAGAGHQIRGRTGATLALQRLGAWRAPSVQLGSGWSQVSKMWPWSYSCLRLLKQTQR